MQNIDWPSFGSFTIAVIALFYSYFSNTKKYELTSQYRSEVLQWYSCTIELLLTLRSTIQGSQPFQYSKEELLAKLSAQIEIGRFYFPNFDKGDGYGTEKPYAYRGYRHSLLDFLVFSYQLYNSPEAKDHLKHADILQRNFSSLFYEILEPRQYLRHTRKYTGIDFSKDYCIEDFIKQDPESNGILYRQSGK